MRALPAPGGPSFLSIAFRDTDSPVIVSRWSQLRERGVARGFDFMKTYSRPYRRGTHVRASARTHTHTRTRALATIRKGAPTFIVRRGDFSFVGGGGTVRVIDSFDPGLRPDLP